MRKGPEVTIRVSCFGCTFCHGERYNVQGDTGSDIYCEHTNFEERKYIGDSHYNTPDFCPEKDEGYKRLGINLQR